MRVRRIDINGDWTFGQGMANYAKDNEAIQQNLLTRLKSFKFDWFLDINAGIDWIGILGNKNNKQIIHDEILRVCRETKGIKKVNSIVINSVNEQRKANISIIVSTIYDGVFTNTLELNL